MGSGVGEHSKVQGSQMGNKSHPIVLIGPYSLRLDAELKLQKVKLKDFMAIYSLDGHVSHHDPKS